MFYNQGMNNSLPVLLSNHMMVMATPRSKTMDLLSLITELAIRGNMRVVDGGNLFNVLRINRMIHSRTSEVKKMLDRIYISRAFTCFQMEAMLHSLSTKLGPIFVLDLLATFYDKSVTDLQSQRLLENSIAYLKHLSCSIPVFVSAFPAPMLGMRPFLLKTLMDASDSTWHWETKVNMVLQPGLWE